MSAPHDAAGRDDRGAAARAPVEHRVKADPVAFRALRAGWKTSEVRWDDRPERYQPDDTLVICEHRRPERYDVGPYGFTGEEERRTITHVQRGYGLPDGLVVLSLAARATPAPGGAEDGGFGAQLAASRPVFEPKHAPGCVDNDCDRSCMATPAARDRRDAGMADAGDWVGDPEACQATGTVHLYTAAGVCDCGRRIAWRCGCERNSEVGRE